LTLKEVANLLAERLVDLYRPKGGRRPAMAAQPPFATSPHWQNLLLFYEYFNADTGQGLGAAHQNGWTGLLANLVMRRYRRHPGILEPKIGHCKLSLAETSGAAGRVKSSLHTIVLAAGAIAVSGSFARG
jgi:hypothetical protein